MNLLKAEPYKLIEIPDPLYETFIWRQSPCLACGKDKAVNVLRTSSVEIVPICVACTTRWRLYGYGMLKSIKPSTLVWNLLKFKLRHPFYCSWFKILNDLVLLRLRSTEMLKYLKKKEYD
jgi:hypothetical protein